MAGNNLTPQISPVFRNLLDTWCGAQIAFVDRVLAQPVLRCCEYEDEFGCGELGVISSTTHERSYCHRHFRVVALHSELAKLETAVGL